MAGKSLDCREEGEEGGYKQRLVVVSAAPPIVFYKILHPEQRKGRTRNIHATVLLGAVHIPWPQEPPVQKWN